MENPEGRPGLNIHSLMPGVGADATAPQTVLVVDDSRAQRRLLHTYLRKMGHRVLEAQSGEVALAICQFEQPDLIVSDWVMPGMDGLELCRRFREMREDRYGYFILLTSKDEKHEVAAGLDAGADDFLTKPVNAAELRARVRAGQRILAMERTLTATLQEMRQLHAVIDRDLVEAQKLQQSLVRDRHRSFAGVDVSLLLRPAGRIGGDLVGLFEVNEDQIGVYALDVSGHGIASALMTAQLAAQFAGSIPGRNIAIGRDARKRPVMRTPSETAARLNDMVLNEMGTEQYLTLVLALVETATGRVVLTQAGHPHPLIQRADGCVETVGSGGLPVGLLPGARFTDVEVWLRPGDRLFFGSDGISECMTPDGDMLEEQGLIEILGRHRFARGEGFLTRLLEDLRAHTGGAEFSDDVSGVLLDFSAP